MVQYIVLIAGGLLILALLIGFFRSLWQSMPRRRTPGSGTDWENKGNDYAGGWDGGGGHHP